MAKNLVQNVLKSQSVLHKVITDKTVVMFTSFMFFVIIILCKQMFGGTITHKEWNTMQATYLLPNSAIFFHSLFFTVLLILLLYPSDAFVGAGLSFDNLAYGYLGSSDLNILEFHCRRVVLARALVASSPCLLVISLYFIEEHAVVFTLHPTRAIHYLALISPVFAAGGVAYLVYHTMTGFRALAAMQKLRGYGYNTQQVFTILSSEFSQVNVFRHAISNVSRLIITDSWLFHCSRFHFVVVKLPETHFRIVGAEDAVNIVDHAFGMNQHLTIAVSLPDDIQYLNFEFKINNRFVRDLEEKLGNNRIEISHEVQLKMSLTDMFFEAFLDQAKKNPRYHDYTKEELEPCLGCSEKLSNIKLLMACHEIMQDLDHEAHRSECSPCQCRPMWCCSCMARIFLAKQDQSRSNMWLEGTCPCPTCRATFCIMDVALLSYVDEGNTTDSPVVLGINEVLEVMERQAKERLVLAQHRMRECESLRDKLFTIRCRINGEHVCMSTDFRTINIYIFVNTSICSRFHMEIKPSLRKVKFVDDVTQIFADICCNCGNVVGAVIK